ncbi:MAG: indolepyruvate oxidoreductase subunit beta family protein [Hyphomicrobiaceae bacterium]|nr:indolepyruvate oxidoreductase subunit beta family protein [Hyphomicrobiaceae bacterium]
MAQTHPVTVLIAALGGEGGGVLAAWLHRSAIAEGHFVQGTSIPGVAQRTGATTYYLEIVPQAGARHRRSDRGPVLALNAAPGEVDLVVASELLEATRAVAQGFVTPERTVLLASSARVFTIDEKAAAGDGRLDAQAMVEMARRCSRRAIFADFTAIAAQAQAPLNAVLLGAVAGSGVLPISEDAFRAAIRAEGKAVDANLRGFEAGRASGAVIPPQRPASPRADAARAPTHEAFQELQAFAADGRPVIAAGVARLTDYQDATFAQRYLARLNRFAGRPGTEGPFLRELARHLALRMSVEDVIRVAQLKLRKERVLRVTREARARAGDIVDITEYLKPGPEEILGLLPPRLGRWALARIPPDLAWPLKVTTTRFSGFLRLKALSALKGWRPYTLRFAEEEAWVERWLNLIDRALALSPAAALEVVATAALVRGYADTYKRGLANWGRIVECIIEPMLAGQLSRALFADAVLQARLAATKDPEGEALAQTIAAIRRFAACEHAAAEWGAA